MYLVSESLSLLVYMKSRGIIVFAVAVQKFLTFFSKNGSISGKMYLKF